MLKYAVNTQARNNVLQEAAVFCANLCVNNYAAEDVLPVAAVLVEPAAGALELLAVLPETPPADGAVVLEPALLPSAEPDAELEVESALELLELLAALLLSSLPLR